MLRGTLISDSLPESFQGLLIRKTDLFAHVTAIWSDVPDASTKLLEILCRYKERGQNENNQYQPTI